MTEAGGVAWRR